MFDFDRFLRDKFRKPQEVRAFLAAYSAPQLPEEESIKKWFQRRKVPSDWFAVLLAYMEIENGVPVRLAPYLER